jgi:hypothetical protein
MGVYEAVAVREPRIGCRTGAKALLAYTHSIGYSDKGCFNPNSWVPGGSLSLHLVGRAVDLWWGDGDWQQFNAFVHSLAEHADEFGIQQILWDGHGWSFQRPYWHVLTAPTDMHRDHAHIELTIDAADHLTVDRITSVLTPAPSPAPMEDDMTPEQFAASIGAHYSNGIVTVPLINDDGQTFTDYPLAAALTYTHQELKLARLRAQ